MNTVVQLADFQSPPTLKNNVEVSAKKISHGLMPLLHAPVDIPLRVTSLGPGKRMTHRLASMGITENSIIKIVHEAGGNLVVAVENTRLAMEPCIAQKIMVIPLSG